MTDKPLILIGAARSGTKFLRDKIAEDERFSCVPYDVNYIWRMPSPGKEDDVLNPELLKPKQIARIENTLTRLAGLSSKSTKRMVEKSVSNALRVPYVEAVFPDAHYLHLVRDGRAVIESSFRMWNAPPDGRGLMRKLKDLPLSQYNYLGWFALNYVRGKFRGRSGGAVWGPRYKGILSDIDNMSLLEVVTLQWRHCVESALRDLRSIPQDRKHFVRYEDLAKNPHSISALADYLQLSDKKAFTNSVGQGFDASNLDKWRSALSKSDLDVIDKHAGDLLAELGYVD